MYQRRTLIGDRSSASIACALLSSEQHVDSGTRSPSDKKVGDDMPSKRKLSASREDNRQQKAGVGIRLGSESIPFSFKQWAQHQSPAQPASMTAQNEGTVNRVENRAESTSEARAVEDREQPGNLLCSSEWPDDGSEEWLELTQREEPSDIQSQSKQRSDGVAIQGAPLRDSSLPDRPPDSADLAAVIDLESFEFAEDELMPESNPAGGTV